MKSELEDKCGSRPQAAQREVAPVAQTRRRISSTELLAGTNELQIEHNGEAYLLRLTRQGKLILTK